MPIRDIREASRVFNQYELGTVLFSPFWSSLARAPCGTIQGIFKVLGTA